MPNERQGHDVRSEEEAARRTEANYQQSSFRESLLEHVFIAEVLQEAWFAREQVVEVLRAEVDAFGYDIVLECGGVVRHIQLKASATHARTSQQTVNMKLAEKPGGCVVWLLYLEDSRHRCSLEYLFFGAQPNQPMPSLGDRVGRNPRGGSPRPGTRVLRRGQFDRVETTGELLTRLFGSA